MQRRADVLVIGGGLAGAATAYYLAKDGVGVTLVERGDLNSLASGSNAGSLHAQIPHEPFLHNGENWTRRFAPTLGLLRRSIELWGGLGEELGADLEVSLKGGLLVAQNDVELRDVERKAVFERAAGLEVEILGRSELHARAPYLSDRLVGAGFCPGEGKANPLAATPAFAIAASRLGAEVYRGTEVTAISRETFAFAVETTRGTFGALRVVDAAGADAGRIAAMVGLSLPVEAHPIQVSVTEPVAPLVPHLVYSAGEKLTLKQTPVGSLLIGGGWPARLHPRTGKPITDPLTLRQNLAVALGVVPALAPIRVVRSWAAVVNGTADWLPILGEAPGVPGFFVNFFPWMGFTAGPIAARIVASLVQGKVPPVDLDLAPFLIRP
jgi:glycine/D-amino acid oxidase-like deaminating enzyme